MGKKKHKKKQTTSGEKQSVSFEPLIITFVTEGQSNDVFNEQIKVIKTVFRSIASNKGNIFKENST